MPATQKKQVDPSHTIEYQRTVINDMAGDLQSLFVGTATINAAAIQVAGADIGAISDHDDKTIFFYYGGFAADTTIGSASKLAEILSHEDAACDVDDGITLTIDSDSALLVSPKTSYAFISNYTEETNPQKLTGFADNIRTSIVKDMALDGNKKVGFVIVPDATEVDPYLLFTPSAATYNKTTGEMVLTIGKHTLTVDDTIKIEPYSLTFTCMKDNNATEHSYPRPGTDPYAGKAIAITAVTSTTITINVGVSPDLKKTVTQADYTPATGVLILTINNHQLTTSHKVTIADNSITFKCAKDNYATLHNYPRSTDPASGKQLDITAVTTNTITVNVGISPDTSVHQFAAATVGGVSHENIYDHTFVSSSINAISSGGEGSDDVPVNIDDTFTVTIDDQAVLII